MTYSVKAKKQFDSLVDYCKKLTPERNMFLVFGYVPMAIYIFGQSIFHTNRLLDLALVGLVVGYIGVSINILVSNGRSRLQKSIAILCGPGALVLIAWLSVS